LKFEHFLSKRILSSKPYKNSISAPIIKIGVAAISIGMIVMIISVGVGAGMKKEIKDKISSFENHITIQSFNNFENLLNPISPDEKFIDDLSIIPEINKIEKIISRFGIVRTSENFDGLYFKGVESNYDFNKIKRYLIEGHIPSFKNNFSNEVLISKILSDKLNLKPGDGFQMLFSKNESSTPSILKLEVSGVFKSGFDELDSKFLFGDLRQIRRILKWKKDQLSSIEIQLYDHKDIKKVSDYIYVNSPSEYDVISVQEKYYTIYEWVELFDKNTFTIIFIMVLVASINIISTLIVMILERRNMIGILKALGLNNLSLQKFFIHMVSYLTLIGITFGNLIGISILMLQKNFKLVSLDSKIYFVDSVPVFIDFIDIIILNIIVFLVCFLSILLPSILISKVNPKDSIKFN